MDEKPLEEKILEDLIQRGLNTEITTFEYLKKAGFSVVTQYPFVDPTSNKVRSVDVKAVYTKLYSSGSKMGVDKTINLFIECKKSEKEKWVFYTELSSPEIVKITRGIVHLRKSLLGKLQRPAHSTTDHWASISEGKLGFIHMSALTDKHMFFQAQMQVLKAIWYYMMRKEEFAPYDADCEMILPVIIFEGDMFEYYSKPALTLEETLALMMEKFPLDPKILESLKRGMKIASMRKELEGFPIRRVQHIPFVSNGIPEDPAPVIIDIVTLDYLPTYLGLVKKEFETLPGRRQ